LRLVVKMGSSPSKPKAKVEKIVVKQIETDSGINEPSTPVLAERREPRTSVNSAVSPSSPNAPLGESINVGIALV
jgi:hypothetical protein